MVLYYSTMVTTRAGHAKMRSAELAASARQYQHPPSYDHDVDIDMIENPPPPFQSSDDDDDDNDDKTINAVEEEENKDKNQSSKLAIKKDSKKR